MRGIDWYAGAGGYTRAMRQVGIEVVGACERDMAKRAAYVEACGVPAWFGEDCHAPVGVPEADLWCACAGVLDIGLLLAVKPWPRWLVLETVTHDVLTLLGSKVLVSRTHPGMSVARASARTFVVLGPHTVALPELPPHSGQGPHSDPRALDIVLGAVVEADK